MIKHKLWCGLTGVVLVASFLLLQGKIREDNSVKLKEISTNRRTPQLTASPAPTLAFPVDDFLKRITKKPFGIFITKANSPVQPERFSGYHTAVDVEYGDVEGDVPVFAVTKGVVVVARIASGYGGVMVLKSQLGGRELYLVYGHLRPSSLPTVGTQVSRGQQLALLGTAYSSETDGERRHLHFGVALTNTILGYVNSESESKSEWIDPLALWR